MKKHLFLIICLLALISQSMYADYLKYTIIDKTNKEVAVQGVKTNVGVGDKYDIAIPESVEIDGEIYTVTTIPDEGFYNSRFRNIILPNTITHIGSYVFYYSGLKNITIGSGILEIGARIFQGCKLESITFLSEIPPLINGCLTEYVDDPVTIKVDKKHIMDYAASYDICYNSRDTYTAPYRYNNIFSFTSDRPLQTLYDAQYEYLVCEETKECIISKRINPENPIHDLAIPDKAIFSFGLASEEYDVVGIGPLAFSTPEAYNLSFENNENFTGTITMGNNIRHIGYGAFGGTCITDVFLSEPVKEIDPLAFYFCRQLGKVHFNENVIQIGRYAFSGTSITEFIAPTNLRNIGTGAFSAPIVNIKLNDKLQYIGSQAFKGSSIKSIVLPNQLRSIKDAAFANCKSLSSVTFGNNLISIGAQAFTGTQLKDIHIPSSVESIGNYAFRNCGLQKAYFDDGINPIEIGEDAIGSDDLKYLYLGRNFMFKSPAFKNLTKIDFGNLVSKIPSSTFQSCLKLTSVSFGSGLTEIGDESFKYCSISDVIIPSKVQKIGSGAFAGNRLYSLTIGSGITEIGDKAFEGNTNLSIINITAATPPKANINVFTSYDSRLYTDLRFSANYKNDNLCWSMFKQYELVDAGSIILDADLIKYDQEQYQLYASLKPEDASLQTVLWESSNPNIATVNTSGLVSIVDNPKNNSLINDATCKIRAYTLYADGPIAECTFTDYTDYTLVSSIILNTDKVEGKEGDQIQISATVLPENATNKVLTWSSSDESVALVDDTGLISLVKKGTTVITASATDNSGVSADCAIIVTEASGIEDILTDKSSYVKIFNLKGIFIFEGKYADARLTPDYYIVVCDGKNIKVKVQ